MIHKAVCLFVFLITLFSLETVIADNTSDLSKIQSQIKTVKTQIQNAKDKTEKLQQELKENEISTAETLTRLQHFTSAITNKQTELAKLKRKKTVSQNHLKIEKEKLKQQIRSAYLIGRNDYIKLILNQHSPATLGRALVYYDYYHRSRSKRITQTQKVIANFVKVETAITEETKNIINLKQKHEKKLQRFDQYRKTRRNIIANLQKEIATQGIELDVLHQNETKLQRLIQGLEKKTVTTKTHQDLPAFSSRKGKMKWPVNGRLLKSFGSLKKNGNLKWQGVLINAATGTNIKAISAGKIVFADWFKNMGLLIIIDHGGGYMSLYGHNQNLLKNTGDWVGAGEKIATVGDTGGQSDIALYFEIRKKGKPLNPAKWCKS